MSDWVELYNASNEDISLGMMALSDDPSKPIKWIFPENAVIKAGGYYLVYCSGKDIIDQKGFPHTNFSINSQEETLVLTTLAGEQIDRVTVRNLDKDTSWGLNPDDLSQWQVYTEPTPGHPNNDLGKAKADEYMRGINYSGVYVTEVMASSALIVPFPGMAACDYVEIYNSSAQPVDLSGWGLSDNIGWPLKWTFPQGTSIFPGEYKVIMLDGSEEPGNNANRLHASFSLARAGGEVITFSDANGYILDKIYLPEIPTDISFGRTLGVNGFFYYDAPTPGAVNGHGFSGFSARPTFSQPSGLYHGNITVTIDVPANTTVRYTLDGSIPTIDNGFIYYPGCPDLTDFSDTKVVRARAFQAGMQPSETVTVSYIVNKYHQMDVVSLVCDPFELWDEKTGLLSDAPDLKYYDDPSTAVVNKEKIPFKTPVYRNWGKIDRPGYVELFHYDSGDAYISQGIKMDLMGAYSLDMPQKSFKIRAQAAYGAKYFDYPLFEDREYTFYKSFTLRNSGNDNVWTRLADGFQTRLVDRYLDQDVMMTLAWRPVAVYLNGVYWGHYNLRERKDRFS
ncbi:MAG: lamin tail domain-containing protein, partial [Clostridia bacterium]|nr:lamin tail domain-containing protein [Clostridia bacterium]